MACRHPLQLSKHLLTIVILTVDIAFIVDLFLSTIIFQKKQETKRLTAGLSDHDSTRLVVCSATQKFDSHRNIFADSKTQNESQRSNELIQQGKQWVHGGPLCRS